MASPQFGQVFSTAVNGGYDLRIPVTFRPARAGRVTGSYRFSWNEQAGTHTLTVPITGTAVG